MLIFLWSVIVIDIWLVCVGSFLSYIDKKDQEQKDQIEKFLFEYFDKSKESKKKYETK